MKIAVKIIEAWRNVPFVNVRLGPLSYKLVVNSAPSVYVLHGI